MMKDIKLSSKLTLGALLSALLINSSASALVVAHSITHDTQAQGVHSVRNAEIKTHTIDNGTSMTVGTDSSQNFYKGIMIFKLPDLGSTPFISSTLELKIAREYNNAPTVDLDILRLSNVSTITTADFSGTAAQANVGTSVLDPSNSAHRDGATVNLGNVLDNYLSANYTAGEYLVLRLNTVDPGGISNRWLLSPTQTLTVVPEPSSYALILGAIILSGILLRRRLKA